MHYWALAADPRRKMATKGDLPLRELAAYARRLYVARSFYKAVKKLGKSRFNNAQRSELKSWGENLTELHVTIYLRIQEEFQRLTAEELAPYTTAENHPHAPGDIGDHDH